MLQSTATAAPPLTGSATLQAQPSPLQSAAAAAAAAATGAAIQQGAKSSSAAAPPTTAENSVVANTAQRNAAAQGPAAAPSKPTVVLSSSGGVTLQAQRRKRRGAISVRRPNAALHRDSADGAGAADGTQPQLPFPLASQGSGSPATADDSRRLLARGEGQWRTLLAHSDCDGFSLVVDPNDELIFEQTCHPHQIKFGFKPKLGGKLQRNINYLTSS
ncbi:hypothetical protein, conserved [Eimeria acervulina]|uniref:Uncharacterized protein n=1 Tax=Eimeria acervulina TaxID=5801 RepID=U6GDA5_EIMAC|nr:hypothetical protein, conserved [Eimeria acervulina]CDI78251.1 hypothetical protein, conserved [Eimeria acervulina]